MYVFFCLLGMFTCSAAGAAQNDVIALAAMGFTPVNPPIEKQVLDRPPVLNQLDYELTTEVVFRQSERDKILSLFAADAPTLPKLDPREIKCLSDGIFHESRGEGEKGMVSVAYVIKNRTADPRFPNSYCGVVYQGIKTASGKLVRNRCQFSFACDDLPDRVRPRDQDLYSKITELAKQVMYEQIVNPVKSSLFFHTTAVKPKWSKRFERIARVGRHIFYLG